MRRSAFGSPFANACARASALVANARAELWSPACATRHDDTHEMEALTPVPNGAVIRLQRVVRRQTRTPFVSGARLEVHRAGPVDLPPKVTGPNEAEYPKGTGLATMDVIFGLLSSGTQPEQTLKLQGVPVYCQIEISPAEGLLIS